MIRTDREFDPVVEVLRLAYRRGLAIQREQAEKNKESGPPSSQEDVPAAAREPMQTTTRKDCSPNK